MSAFRPTAIAPLLIASLLMPSGFAEERREGQSGASGAAMAAAAMQGMTCMMMMKEAKSMPPGPEKSMMMMMAMQQCAQAAQSAQNGQQNKEGADKLKDEKPYPTPSPLPSAKPLQLTDDKMPEIPEMPYTPPTFAKPDIQLPEEKESEDNDRDLASVKPAAEAYTVPDPVGKANLGYDENGKTSGNGTPGRDLGFGSTPIAALSMMNGGDFGGAKKALEGFQSLDKAARGRGTQGESLGEADSASGGSGGGGGGGGAKEEGGNSALDSMLAMLGGGGGAGPESLGFGAGSDILAPPAQEKGAGAGPNIFQYASFRYAQAATDGKIRRVVK